MATITTENPETVDGSSATPFSGTRSRRRTSAAASGSGSRRSRRTSLAGDALVSSLTEMVDQLIRENRQLKRAIVRAEKSAGSSAGLGQAARALTGLQRRVDRALSSSATPRGRRAAAPTAAASRPRRKVTDPEVLERRRQALVKARAARQAKRQAA